MKIACVQTVSAATGPARKIQKENLARAVESIAHAASGRAGLIVFPELSVTGYLPELLRDTPDEELEAMMHEADEAFARAAAAHRITVAAGLVEVAPPAIRTGIKQEPGAEPKPKHRAAVRRYNTIRVYGSDGAALASYRKRFLFPNSLEPALFEPGEGPAAVFDTDGVSAAILICYELRFPELTLDCIGAGCGLLLYPSAFPVARARHWRTLLEARAVENQLYVAAPNQAGSFGRARFAGESLVTDPSGRTVAAAASDREEILFAEIDPELVRATRAAYPFLADRLKAAGRPADRCTATGFPDPEG